MMNGQRNKWVEIVMFLIHLAFLIDLVLVLAMMVQDKLSKFM